MKSAEERKQQSIALLKEQGVPYIENLANNHHLRLNDESRAQIQLSIDELEAEYGA